MVAAGLCCALSMFHVGALRAQVVSNNGADISLTSGVVLIAKDILNGSGSITNNGAMELTGDWTNNATFSAGTGTLKFYGTSAQNINGSAATQTFYNVEITNTSGVTLSGSSAFNISGSMTIGNGAFLSLPAGPVLTYGSGSSITTTGTGSIHLASGASYINLSSSAPTLQVNRTITGSEGWRMLASPNNVTVGSMFAGNFVTQGFTGSSFPSLQPNLLWWDETDGGTSLQAWRSPSAMSDAVTLGKGYMYFVFDGAQRPDIAVNYPDSLPLTISASGTERPLNTAFDFVVTATARGANDTLVSRTFTDIDSVNSGWNLVGNPTPSTIDWSASSGWTKTNMDASIYVWNPADTVGGYKTWNGIAGSLGNGKIAPFQAFWVKANAASPLLKCDNNVKSTGASFLGKTARDSVQPPPILTLNLSANGLQTQAYLMFSPSGKLTHDPLDAFSLVPPSDKYLILYSVAGQGQSAMQIQSLPDTGFARPFTLPLYVGGTVGGQPLSGSFTLSWNLDGQLPAGWTIALMDDFTGIAYPMSKESKLTFGFVTPPDLVPSSGSFLQKTSGVASNQRSFLVLPQPAVHTVPAAKLSKGAAASRFRLVVSAHDDLSGYLPTTPELAQNYPNPFNPSTNISFSVPERSRVLIQISNILGQKVKTLIDEDYPAGKHVVVWNATRTSSGVYFCTMIVGKHTQTKKMVLLR
jgi:hypothetical protein